MGKIADFVYEPAAEGSLAGYRFLANAGDGSSMR